MVENGINIKAAATRDSVPKFCVMAIKLIFQSIRIIFACEYSYEYSWAFLVQIYLRVATFVMQWHF